MRKVISRRLAVLFIGPIFFVLAGCSSVLGGGGVEEASDVSVGECVSVKDASDGKVKPSKADCDGSSEFTFYVASKLSSSQSCSGSLSTLTFEKGDEKVCLAPNLASDKCYQLPTGEGGGLPDFAAVECGATPSGKTVIAKVDTRGTADAECASGQQALTFTEPKSIGYCLTIQ